jgi:hypothetical protein
MTHNDQAARAHRARQMREAERRERVRCELDRKNRRARNHFYEYGAGRAQRLRYERTTGKPWPYERV